MTYNIIHISYTIFFERSNSLANIVNVSKQLEYKSWACIFFNILYFKLNDFVFFVFLIYKLYVFISSPGHRPCELLSWLSVRRRHPSVSFSHLILLWNHWTELKQTCQKCSLDDPLPDLCFWCWFEIQHGCQGP